MSPRPHWKGYLKLSLVSCPIAVHAACSSSERVSFRQISRKTGNRLRQQLIDEEELAFADLVAPGLLGALDRFAGLLIDKLLAQPVTGLAVDLPERNPLR